MTGLPETKYMRIFLIQEIDHTRRLQRDRSLRAEGGGRGCLCCPAAPSSETGVIAGLVGIVEHIVVNKR